MWSSAIISKISGNLWLIFLVFCHVTSSSIARELEEIPLFTFCTNRYCPKTVTLGSYGDSKSGIPEAPNNDRSGEEDVLVTLLSTYVMPSVWLSYFDKSRTLENSLHGCKNPDSTLVDLIMAPLEKADYVTGFIMDSVVEFEDINGNKAYDPSQDSFVSQYSLLSGHRNLTSWHGPASDISGGDEASLKESRLWEDVVQTWTHSEDLGWKVNLDISSEDHVFSMRTTSIEKGHHVHGESIIQSSNGTKVDVIVDHYPYQGAPGSTRLAVTGILVYSADHRWKDDTHVVQQCNSTTGKVGYVEWDTEALGVSPASDGASDSDRGDKNRDGDSDESDTPYSAGPSEIVGGPDMTQSEADGCEWRRVLHEPGSDLSLKDATGANLETIPVLTQFYKAGCEDAVMDMFDEVGSLREGDAFHCVTFTFDAIQPAAVIWDPLLSYGDRAAVHVEAGVGSTPTDEDETSTPLELKIAMVGTLGVLTASLGLFVMGWKSKRGLDERGHEYHLIGSVQSHPSECDRRRQKYDDWRRTKNPLYDRIDPSSQTFDFFTPMMTEWMHTGTPKTPSLMEAAAAGASVHPIDIPGSHQASSSPLLDSTSVDAESVLHLPSPLYNASRSTSAASSARPIGEGDSDEGADDLPVF
eukprot:Rmarinus@m.24066